MKRVRVEGYRFGSIRLDGVDYSEDLLIVRGEVRCPWRRTAGGHLFAAEDLTGVIAAAPAVVLLGTGYFGLARVSDGTLRAFSDAGSHVVSGRTGRMVDELIRLLAEGRDVAAALHLTC